MGIAIFLFGVPSALCNGANHFFSNLKLLPKAGVWLNWLDSFDYLASNWLLPLGGLFIAIFAGWFLTREEKLSEFSAETKPIPIINYIFFSLKFISPILVGIIMLNKIGLLSF
jgi:NSS family neurotransmitter:Na+ symporter